MRHYSKTARLRHTSPLLVRKWVQRYQQHGEAEPADRHKTPPDLEQRRATTLPANPLQMPTPRPMPGSAWHLNLFAHHSLAPLSVDLFGEPHTLASDYLQSGDFGAARDGVLSMAR
jgi:hypothetical protein